MCKRSAEAYRFTALGSYPLSDPGDWLLSPANYPEAEQLIFIVVEDQTMQPLSGVSGIATVTWTDGTQDTLMILTGDSGVSTLSLSVKDQEYGGLVAIDVLVDYDGVQEHTRSSFRISY